MVISRLQRKSNYDQGFYLVEVIMVGCMTLLVVHTDDFGMNICVAGRVVIAFRRTFHDALLGLAWSNT